MVVIASIQLFLSILITKKANAKFKKEEMDKKLDASDFELYKSEHKDVHDRDRTDMLYIRGRVDEIAAHLLNKK